MASDISHEERTRRAKKIRPARKARGLTQSDLAKLAGVDYRSLQAWETGTAPQVDNLLKVEQALGITYDTGLPPDLNGASPDIYAALVAIYTILESMEPADRGVMISRLFLAIRA